MVKSGSLFALVTVVLVAVAVSGSDGKFEFQIESVSDLSNGFILHKNSFIKTSPVFQQFQRCLNAVKQSPIRRL